MAKILRGKVVADKIIQDCASRVSEALTCDSVVPKLAVVSIGEDKSNDSYLNGIENKASEAGVLFEHHQFSEDVSIDKIKDFIQELNDDEKVNGILLLRPLPKSILHFESELCELIDIDKDVDAARQLSVAGAYLGIKSFCTCTAESCMAILHHYNIEIEGKHAVVIGRSLVVGKPVGNLLLNENATVTLCHSKSQNMEKITRSADIVIVAVGQAKKFGPKYFSEGQVVIDAGINWDEKESKLCGDVDFEAVEPKVGAITPVPGGVGAVTSAIIISHTAQ